MCLWIDERELVFNNYANVSVMDFFPNVSIFDFSVACMADKS